MLHTNEYNEKYSSTRGCGGWCWTCPCRTEVLQQYLDRNEGCWLFLHSWLFQKSHQGGSGFDGPGNNSPGALKVRMVEGNTNAFDLSLWFHSPFKISLPQSHWRRFSWTSTQLPSWYSRRRCWCKRLNIVGLVYNFWFRVQIAPAFLLPGSSCKSNEG